MWKKLLIGILTVTTIFINSSISYGADNFTRRNLTMLTQNNNQDNNKYRILKPEEDMFASSDKIVLVSGTAPEGTNVTIEAFGTTDMTRNNFNLTNLPSEEDYIRRLSETIKVGGMGRFSKELNLILGVNKIIVTFRNAEDEVVGQKIIYVSDLNEASESIDSICDSNMSDVIEQR